MKRLVIGSDHAGFALKEALKKAGPSLGVVFEDVGAFSTESVDYPDFADAVCKKLSGRDDDQGILICGSGIGISIAANRWAHIRASLCESVDTVRRGREHNHTNVLCMGQQIVSEATALEMVKTFLNTAPDPGERHLRRVQKLQQKGSTP